MKKDSKTLLFERMEKLNPDFQSKLNEQMSGDIQSIEKATTLTQKSANSRINSPTEFPEAFRQWFSTLGFSPDKNPIAIGKVSADVTKIMRELGYK